MGDKCPFCNFEHDEILDRVSKDASDIAMEFTEKSFDKIWNLGMASKMSEQMSKEDMAKMMFHTGATQMLVEHLMNEHEEICKDNN